jgi:hypothetical protein
MQKIFVASQANFPDRIIRSTMIKLSKLIDTDNSPIVYTYYSKQGNTIQKYCSENDIRVIKMSNNDKKGIDGIITGINLSNSIILFYNHVEYSTGLDLIFKIGITFNIPTLVYSQHRKLPLIFYNGDAIEGNNNLNKIALFKPPKVKKTINGFLINYTITKEEPILNLEKSKETLANNYRKILEMKKRREIILI